MVLKTAGEVAMMDEANRIVHLVLNGVAERIRPGVTTRELDAWAEQQIRSAGAVPAFLNYRGYPATLCTSVNDVIVHGIPGETVLRRAISSEWTAEWFITDTMETPPARSRSAKCASRLSVCSTSPARPWIWRWLRFDPGPGSPISVQPCSVTSRRTASRWCGSSSVTESGPRSTRSRRCRTTASPAGV
jgi:hypothetical protein